MSALRLSTPTDGVRLLDLGPCPWVPIYGTATMRGHIARPGPTDYRVVTGRKRDGLRGSYGPRCPREVIRSGEPCGRVVGHPGYCRAVREPIHDEHKRAVWAAATRRYRAKQRGKAA